MVKLVLDLLDPTWSDEQLTFFNETTIGESHAAYSFPS